MVMLLTVEKSEFNVKFAKSDIFIKDTFAVPEQCETKITILGVLFFQKT